MKDRIVHYVDSRARIHKVAHIGESGGRVDIRFADGSTQNVSSMDVTITARAAQIVAVNKTVKLAAKSSV